ncbi:MAG: MotA/TolQ/ExbB proton channel family protein [Lysobacteraceae bacterium]
MRAARYLSFVLAASLPLAASAQDAAPAETTPAAAPVADATVSLEQAYKKEFALLQAQKRELAGRIAEVKRQFESDRARLEGQISSLETRALTTKAEAENLAGELARADERTAVNAENSDLLAATVEQARATLDGFGDNSLSDAAFENADDLGKLQTMFGSAATLLQQLGQVRREEGTFYLGDGSEVAGTVIRFGNIARFGVSEQGSGALAPAGGGRFRLWSAPAEDSAKALVDGKLPAQLSAFLYENANTAVAEPEAKTAVGEVQKGGLIGWVIVLLGLLALVLVILRAIFLKRAGADIQNIIDAVSPKVRAGQIDDAIAACKRFKGSAARVVTAALRNLGREREHLEDIVSESILHESTRLSRFSAVITVIAAVAPLLGLLGTVTGMIQTFDVITEFGTSDPKLLSGGIATALVTTELGLIVAIPCLLFGSLLNGWADRLKDDMEKAALKVINLAQDVRDPVTRAAA